MIKIIGSLTCNFYRTLSWRDLESELINWNKNESNLMSRDGFKDTYKDDEGYDFITVNFC